MVKFMKEEPDSTQKLRKSNNILYFYQQSQYTHDVLPLLNILPVSKKIVNIA
jgi:hypothetical protein